MKNLLYEVESRLVSLRDQKALLDKDVAELYGVETKNPALTAHGRERNDLRDIFNDPATKPRQSPCQAPSPRRSSR